MTTFAVALQVFLLTGSSVAVGGVGLAGALPAIAFGLLGGSIVDAVDRRKLVLGLQLALMGVSILFAVQAIAGANSLWLLYVLVAVQATLTSVSGPARRTFMPR